jgi:tryptophanase
MHFDTTEANVLRCGGTPVNLAVPEAYDTAAAVPFKVRAAAACFEGLGGLVRLCLAHLYIYTHDNTTDTQRQHNTKPQPKTKKGNMDVDALDAFLTEKGAAAVPLVMLTVTNNSAGGQPVSMSNVRAVAGVCKRHGVPLYIDAARFAGACGCV